jgi:NitT/TauT family transport system substrate-binding protein
MLTTVPTGLLSPKLIIALVSLLTACGGAAPQSVAPKGRTPAATAKHVRLAINNPVLEPGISFLWIGKELGYFDEEKLTVKFVPSQGAAEAIQWAASGKVDLAVPEAGAW